MSRRFNEQRNNPQQGNYSRGRRGNSNYNEPRQSYGQHQQAWRPFENPEPFAQSENEQWNEPRNEQRWNEPRQESQQNYDSPWYGTENRAWNEERWNEPRQGSRQQYGNTGYRAEDSAWNEQRWNDQGYRTTQDYGDIGYRGDDRARNVHRSYGNPYWREAGYRPYESGYDAPGSSMAREHYQPTSAMGNPERYAYRDDPDHARYGQGNYRGNYGSSQGDYGSSDWNSRRREANYRGVGPRNYQRSDQRITEDINDRLNDNPYIDASDIQVKVKEGEVILEGTVDSRWSKHHVEDIADAVSGVKDVENRIHIKKNIWEKEKDADKTSANPKNKLAETGTN